MIRFLTCKDIEPIRQAKELWMSCFDDSAEFTDYYFTKRSSPEHILCNIRDGEVVSMLHALPYRISINGERRNAYLVAGVCTSACHRGNGYASELMTYLHENVRSDAFILQPVDAEMFGFYERLGYRQLCTYYTLTVENTAERTERQPVADFMHIAGLYTDFAERFDSDLCGGTGFIRNAIEECKTGEVFTAYTDTAFALCSESDGICDVMYVIGQYSEKLRDCICRQTDCRTVRILLSQYVDGAVCTPFNMIRTDMDMSLAGRVLTNLYY